LRNSLRKVFGDRNLVKRRRRTYQGDAWHLDRGEPFSRPILLGGPAIPRKKIDL
jgi:hypothetical protein